jgi:hypothetical protein
MSSRTKGKGKNAGKQSKGTQKRQRSDEEAEVDPKGLKMKKTSDSTAEEVPSLPNLESMITEKNDIESNESNVEGEATNESNNLIKPKVDEENQNVEDSEESQDEDDGKENATGTDADTQRVLRQASGGKGFSSTALPGGHKRG